MKYKITNYIVIIMGFYKSKVRERERIYHKIKTIKLKYAIILLCKIIAILSKK